MSTSQAENLLQDLASSLDADKNTPGGFARKVAEAGGLEADDEAILAALTREIDVRKRLRARYSADFSAPDGEASAPAPAVTAIAALFLLGAQTSARSVALKRINTGLKASDMAAGAGAAPRAALLTLLQALTREGAP